MPESSARVTLRTLQDMKRAGEKSVALVVWDCHMATIAERAGVELISVGDSVGVNLWGRRNPLQVSLEEMLLVCQAVRTSVQRSLLSCDFPYGPLQEGPGLAVRAAIALTRDGGADLVKLDGAAEFPEAVEQVTKAGVPVFAQFGITPQTALRHGIEYEDLLRSGVRVPDEMIDELVAQAKRLESAGAALLDFTSSGPVAGPAVTAAVSIPVLGGLGGGPWLDGRVRMAHAAIGYSASMLDDPRESYANVAGIALPAFQALVDDVRAKRQIKGGIPI